MFLLTWFSHCDFKILFWRNLMLNSVTNAYPFLHSLIQLSVACLQKPFNFLVSQFNHNFTQFEALLFKTLPCWSFVFVTIFFSETVFVVLVLYFLYWNFNLVSCVYWTRGCLSCWLSLGWIHILKNLIQTTWFLFELLYYPFLFVFPF